MNWLRFLIQPSSQLTPILSPVMITMLVQQHQILDHILRNPAISFWMTGEKYDCCFPSKHFWAEALWYVRLYVSKQRWAGLCYLTALQHPVDEPLCQTPLQGMVFVRAWAKATTSNLLLSCFLFHLQNRSSAYSTSLQLHWLDPNKI